MSRIQLLAPLVLLVFAHGSSAFTVAEIIDATGVGGSNTLQGPIGLTVGPDGNVYVAGEGNCFDCPVFQIEPDGTKSLFISLGFPDLLA